MELLRDNLNALYINGASGYIDVYICQYLSSGTFKVDSFYC